MTCRYLAHVGIFDTSGSTDIAKHLPDECEARYNSSQCHQTEIWEEYSFRRVVVGDAATWFCQVLLEIESESPVRILTVMHCVGQLVALVPSRGGPRSLSLSYLGKQIFVFCDQRSHFALRLLLVLGHL